MALAGLITFASEAENIATELTWFKTSSVKSSNRAQLSRANTITSYFVPILNIAGISEDNRAESIMLSGFYGVVKLVFVTLASFVFIDMLGRRRSLFFGATLQGLTDVYMAIYIKIRQDSGVSKGASEAALAMLFLHAWGCIVGESA